ncbi:uncharacterized protein LOC122310285 [Carya illinoinensis]|uniref:uncharacterized protein LOC122310285 n=1 Tax=Carya illinoinensis TaxID=32201 RepID=UPI001C72845F|nr:uncharacterized protein LOC122310285 [Carya illinoinensis]
MDLLEQDDMVSFATTSWLIWKRRNEMIFRKCFLHPRIVAQNSKHLVEELQLAKQQNKKLTGKVQRQAAWVTPPRGRLKLNWDASLDKIRCRVGVGAVIRDHEGQVLATLRMQHDLFPDPFLAEAYAALQASIFCKSSGYKGIIMEGDSLQVVKGLNSASDSHTYAGQLIADTKTTLSSFTAWSAGHTVRANNCVAHALSKDALGISGYTTTFGSVPLCIRTLVFESLNE